MSDRIHCPICSGTLLKTIQNKYKLDKFKKLFTLKKCLKCEHVFIINKPSNIELNKYYKENFWDDKNKLPLASNWIDNLKMRSGSYERFIRAKKQLNYIIYHKKLDKKAKILDIGSGFAPILYHFQKLKFRNLYALELDTRICKYIEKQGVNSINMSLEKLALTKEKFDLIILSHTLEHISDPNSFIESINKISQYNTTLFIEVPYLDFLEPYNENMHLHFFSQKSLKSVVNKIRFNILHTEVDKLGMIDKYILFVLYKIYEKVFFKKYKSINSNSKVIELIHLLWRPIRKIIFSKINIFISRRDIRVIANFEKIK